MTRGRTARVGATAAVTTAATKRAVIFRLTRPTPRSSQRSRSLVVQRWEQKCVADALRPGVAEHVRLRLRRSETSRSHPSDPGPGYAARGEPSIVLGSLAWHSRKAGALGRSLGSRRRTDLHVTAPATRVDGLPVRVSPVLDPPGAVAARFALGRAFLDDLDLHRSSFLFPDAPTLCRLSRSAATLFDVVERHVHQPRTQDARLRLRRLLLW